MYIDEPMPNPIRKFEPESNMKLAKPEHEPEPCDIGSEYSLESLV